MNRYVPQAGDFVCGKLESDKMNVNNKAVIALELAYVSEMAKLDALPDKHPGIADCYVALRAAREDLRAALTYGVPYDSRSWYFHPPYGGCHLEEAAAKAGAHELLRLCDVGGR